MHRHVDIDKFGSCREWYPIDVIGLIYLEFIVLMFYAVEKFGNVFCQLEENISIRMAKSIAIHKFIQIDGQSTW
jgi:hypothetical protein